MAARIEPSANASPGAGAERFRAGLWRENPVLVQALGMCPTLAVSNTAINALTMGLATASVLMASALVISAIRGLIPPQVRLACFVLVIATFVTIASLLLEAFAPALHGNLGAFLSLIVVNCIILGRIEAVASRQPVHVAAADALGMGGGFVLGLVALGSLRELLGQGALFGQRLLPEAFEPWQVLQLPAGGFFALAALVLGFRAVDRRRRAREVPT